MKEMKREIPRLARPLSLRCERFNGHLAQGKGFLEFGTTGNTIEEASWLQNIPPTALAAVIKSQ